MVPICCLLLLVAGPAWAVKKGAKKPAAPPAAAATAPPAAAADAAPTPPAAAAAPPESTASTPATAPAADAAAASPTPPAADAVPPAPPVLTPEAEAIAKRHFDAGEQAFRDKKYETALDEFTSAYDIMKHPDLMYNLYKVAVKLGQKDMALNYLGEYKRMRPAEAATIDQEIAKLQATDLKPEPVAPAVPPPPPPPPPPPEASGPPRRSGHALIGIGSVFLATGVALLGVSQALTQDTPADMTRNQGMLVSGGFLAGTGALALIGGIVITVKGKAPARAAVSSVGSRLFAAGLY